MALLVAQIVRRIQMTSQEPKQQSKWANSFHCVITLYFYRQHKKELQELRKKKVQKKVARLQEIEEAREKEKQRWKEFAYKSAKKGAPIGGKQKRSIFAVPDSIHGKVFT